MIRFRLCSLFGFAIASQGKRSMELWLPQWSLCEFYFCLNFSELHYWMSSFESWRLSELFAAGSSLKHNKLCLLVFSLWRSWHLIRLFEFRKWKSTFLVAIFIDQFWSVTNFVFLNFC